MGSNIPRIIFYSKKPGTDTIIIPFPDTEICRAKFKYWFGNILDRFICVENPISKDQEVSETIWGYYCNIVSPRYTFTRWPEAEPHMNDFYRKTYERFIAGKFLTGEE